MSLLVKITLFSFLALIAFCGNAQTHKKSAKQDRLA